MWRVVLQCFATLGKRWRELAQEYNKVITGQDREEPRWEQCMTSVCFIAECRSQSSADARLFSSLAAWELLCRRSTCVTTSKAKASKWHKKWYPSRSCLLFDPCSRDFPFLPLIR